MRRMVDRVIKRAESSLTVGSDRGQEHIAIVFRTEYEMSHTIDAHGVQGNQDEYNRNRQVKIKTT